MNKKIVFLILVSVLILPVTALAAVDSIQSLMAAIVNIALWVVFGGIVIICFIYSAILFLTSGGQPEKIKTAKASFLWGVVGVVVGIIAYSIINIVESFLR